MEKGKQLEDASRKYAKVYKNPAHSNEYGLLLAFKAGADWRDEDNKKHMSEQFKKHTEVYAWTDEDMLAFAAYQGQKATSNKGFYFESEALQWLEDYKKKHK